MQDQSPESILIIKLSAIGDVVHSLPFLEVLRRRFPDARIDWLVEETASQIIEGHPALDRMLVSRRKSWQERVLKGREFLPVFGEVLGFLKDLRSREYDLVIDLQGLLKSGVLIALSRGERKIGLSGSREGARYFLNESPVPVEHDQHAVDRYLKMARYLGCDSDGWKGEIPLFGSQKRRMEHILNSNAIGTRPFVAINPMAKWKTKLWEPQRFAALSDRIKGELGCEIIFTGSEQDREVIGYITGMMKARALNLAGQTSLKELGYLYSRSKALISTDTGPMHMAAAMGCPVVALFGPTAPWRTGPYGHEHRVVRADLDCSPCFNKRCKHISCMKDISVDMVLEGVKEISGISTQGKKGVKNGHKQGTTGYLSLPQV